MFGWYIDPVYLWVLVIVMIISLVVQLFMRSTFSKWGGVRNGAGLNGMQVAQQLFDRTALQPIRVEHTSGTLTDHFDPGANVVRLSDSVAGEPSVASMAVTAHELGHVQQYQSGSALIKARGVLLPALQFSPTISYLAILFGLIFNVTGLLWIGVLFFALMVLFSILTLPIEIDASRRGLRMLEEADVMQTEEDKQGSRRVLMAAASTYLAAAITSILQLLYYISVAQRNS
jgi:Zn-dependent membrane protease YugP